MKASARVLQGRRLSGSPTHGKRNIVHWSQYNFNLLFFLRTSVSFLGVRWDYCFDLRLTCVFCPRCMQPIPHFCWPIKSQLCSLDSHTCTRTNKHWRKVTIESAAVCALVVLGPIHTKRKRRSKKIFALAWCEQTFSRLTLKLQATGLVRRRVRRGEGCGEEKGAARRRVRRGEGWGEENELVKFPPTKNISR